MKKMYPSPYPLLVVFALLLVVTTARAQEKDLPMPETDDARAEALSATTKKAAIKVDWGLWMSAYYLLTVRQPQGGRAQTLSTVSNGFLPAMANFTPSWSKNGWVIKGNVTGAFSFNSIGFSPVFSLYNASSRGGLAANTGSQGDQFGYSVVDMPQVYFDIEHKKYGKLRMGRDYGLYGFDVVLNDIALNGMGASYSPMVPQHTGLGGVGYGYVYAERFAQINYSTPSMGGVVLTAGIFQPFGQRQRGVGGTTGFQAKVSFDKDLDKNGRHNLYLSSAYTTQRIDSNYAGYAFGWEVYARLKLFNNLTLSGYVYGGDGIGDIAVFLNGFDKDSKRIQTTFGYMAQIIYKLPALRNLTVGAYVGHSQLSGIVPIGGSRTNTPLANVVRSTYRVTASLSVPIGPVIPRVEWTYMTNPATFGLSGIAPAPNLDIQRGNLIAIGCTFTLNSNK